MTGQPPRFLYRTLVDKLTGLIDRGVLRPGERLPSLRRIAGDERVSLTTALQAYGVLESLGYIEARPRSGYRVCDTGGPLPEVPATSVPDGRSAPVDVGDLVADLLRGGQNPDLIPLGAATPGGDLLPRRAMDRLLTAAIRRSGRAGEPDSSFPPGEPDLRRQIARRSLEWGGGLDPDGILVTAGGTQAIDLCLRAVTGPGDLVAVESPCYFGILLLLEALGLPVIEIPTHSGEGIRLDSLAAALASHDIRACVLSPCFSNPLGSRMPDGAKRDLVAMLRRRGIPLIEDDTYGELCHRGPRPRPAKAFDADGLVMLCSSFSKILAPGYRIGWVAPGRFRDRVERLQLASTLAAPGIFQRAVSGFLESGAYDRHLRRLQSAAGDQCRRMAGAIGALFPAGTRVTRPDGGILLWVELPDGVDAIDLSRRALAAGIGVCPGPVFSATGRYRNFIRLNAGCPWSPVLEQALARLSGIVRQ
ncbi:MAG: PLP-dependent aminotransferase family protein [Telmatospirillum sp.]|nr:PLP-dependent aminotransferase family protein [Telmatospirillum sp.]